MATASPECNGMGTAVIAPCGGNGLSLPVVLAPERSNVNSGIDTAGAATETRLISVAQRGHATISPDAARMSWALWLTLAVSSTAQYISSSALSLYIVLDLSFGTVQLTHFWMYMGWAAWASPVVGCVSDNFVAFGERRRPCVVLGLLGNIAIWASVWAFPALSDNYLAFVAVTLLQTVMQMCVGVPLNALVVELGTHCEEARQSEEHRTLVMSQLQSRAMVARSIGSLVGAIGQTLLLLAVSVHALLGLSIAFYILVSVPLLFIDVDESSILAAAAAAVEGSSAETPEATSVAKKWRALVVALRQSCAKGVRGDAAQFFLVLFFVLIYCSTPDASMVYYQYVALEFAFPKWFLSFNSGVGLVGGILATIFFGRWMQYDAKKLATRGNSSAFRVFTLGCIASAIGYLTNVMVATGFTTDTLKIPPAVFIPIDNFCTSFMARIAFMPVLQVAAERSPRGFEGFVYELFSVASLGGSSVSALTTAAMASSLRLGDKSWGLLWALLVACAGCKLIPVFIAAGLPSTKVSSATSATDEDQSGSDGSDDNSQSLPRTCRSDACETDPILRRK